MVRYKEIKKKYLNQISIGSMPLIASYSREINVCYSSDILRKALSIH